MSSSNTEVVYLPGYASYNWTGAPSDYSLSTNPDLGGDSRVYPPPQIPADIH
jgi:ammonium transporter, Amt family